MPGEVVAVVVDGRRREEPGMRPCKFAEKVWNAQLAGAVGVRP